MDWLTIRCRRARRLRRVIHPKLALRAVSCVKRGKAHGGCLGGIRRAHAHAWARRCAGQGRSRRFVRHHFRAAPFQHVAQARFEGVKKGEAPRTAQLALAATEADESNAQAFHLLAIALEKLGHTHKALVTYERGFQLEPDDTDLLLDFGLTAWNLGMLEGAERMFQLYIEKLPDRPEGYNNLGSVQRDRGDLAAALATLQGALYRMPEQPMLWNTLATVLAEEGRVEESLDFYGEALRLDPRLGRAWHNLGYAYSRLGRLAEAFEVVL